MPVLSTILLTACLSAAGDAQPPAGPGNARNEKAVEEVRVGKRTEANAAWWGFDEDDSTDAIQAAIRSGARKVIIPNMGKDWIVRPIQLAGNQEVVFEPGAVLAARRGAYRGGGDTVFTATGVDNLVLRGPGATIRMNKEDYIVGLVLKDLGWHRWFDQYSKAEWRNVVSLRGCRNVTIEGLTLRDSGGDGIYIDAGGDRPASFDVTIRGVTCDNNYRQGISVISVDGLTAEGCEFRNTWGTPPSSGVDLEPDSPTHKLKRIVFRDCRFLDNYGDGIEVFLAHLNGGSDPVSMRFEKCRITSRWGSGIRVTKVHDDGPRGAIEFLDCLVEGTAAMGIKVQEKSAGGARVRFVRCTLKDTARDRNFQGAWAPICFEPRPGKVEQFGGIDFDDCKVEDTRPRPTIDGLRGREASALRDIRGTITAANPLAVAVDLRQPGAGVTLEIVGGQPAEARSAAKVLGHVTVFHQRGRFGGWPANHGIWSWGDEILVGFSAGYYKDLGAERHNIDRERPEQHLLARSLDGGRSWSIENPAEHGALIPVGRALHGVETAGLKEKPWRDCPGGIDFTHPNFAMTVRMTDVNSGPSRFYYSTDRGHRWEGPFRLPLFGRRGIAARTDYIVNGQDDCQLFLTAAKADGREGRPICVRTRDGGKTWDLVSFIGEEPAGFAIMPSTVRIGRSELLTAIRHKEGSRHSIDLYRSLDDGKSWKLESVPAPDLGEGNPASMIRLVDGRICLTYGNRAAPFSIRARLSRDAGHTWEPEIILRDDGGGRDLGYPRTVQRPDGKVLTIYYFWDRKTGPERYIAATIWDPGKP